MPDIIFNYMALSFRFKSFGKCLFIWYIFDINTTICRVKGIEALYRLPLIIYPKLYKGIMALRFI
jgi:hypothetical protein